MIPGSLYVIATPIGNLRDASARAIEVLRAADLIACEDTRTSRTLLARHAISGHTIALHEHNERATAAKLVRAMHAGKNVALISDAGTPALSDPGWLLADSHRQQGEFVLVLAPGESRPAQTLEAERVLEALLGALAPSEAARLAARITGIPKSVLYRKALERAK